MGKQAKDRTLRTFPNPSVASLKNIDTTLRAFPINLHNLSFRFSIESQPRSALLGVKTPAAVGFSGRVLCSPSNSLRLAAAIFKLVWETLRLNPSQARPSGTCQTIQPTTSQKIITLSGHWLFHVVPVFGASHR